MRFNVLDTETTDVDPAAGAVMLELACVVVEETRPAEWERSAEYEVTDGASWLVRYDGVIPPISRAVHHLGPADVGPGSSALDREVVMDIFQGDWIQSSEDIMVAHNAPFDRKFLPELDEYRWIDTYRVSKHLVPDCPKHSNQVLRYYLDLEPRADFLVGLSPHRALYDTAVTGELLRHLLTLVDSPEELIRLSTEPILETICKFGQAHRDKPWSEVPWSYLSWILNKSDVPDDPVGNMDLLHTVRHYYNNR